MHIMSRLILTSAGLVLISLAANACAQAVPTPADAFLTAIAQHCGQAFEGRIIANTPASAAPDPFEGKTLVMHVRECSDSELRIPFHVGDDHSRTWILTRTANGLRLKHDHRLEDGSNDPVTMYGGDTSKAGSAQRQSFPVDAESIALFKQGGMDVSTTNVWAMEVGLDQRFLYELARPGSDRLFRVEFDLSKPVDLPPPPWGSEKLPHEKRHVGKQGAVSSSQSLPTEHGMNSADFIRTYFDTFNRHDWDALASMYSPTATFKDPSLGVGLFKQSREDFVNKYRELSETFPDLKDTVVSIYPSGANTVIVEFVSTGTAPDGSQFELPICTIFEIEDGQITKDFTYYDNFE